MFDNIFVFSTSALTDRPPLLLTPPSSKDVPDMLRKRLGQRIPEPLLLPAELSPGQPAFGPDGKLLPGLHYMLKLQASQRTTSASTLKSCRIASSRTSSSSSA